MSLAFPGFRNHIEVDAFGLFTGQVGYAANNVLLYVKGGAAVTSNSYRINNVASGALAGVTGDDTRWGGTVGVGLEYAFAPNWSVGDRIRSPVHAGPYLHLHHAGRRLRSAPIASVRTSISSPPA